MNFRRFVLLFLTAFLFSSDLLAQVVFEKASSFVGAMNAEFATDSVGNLYATGGFRGTLDIDYGPNVYNLTSNGTSYSDTYITKVDKHGNLVWARQMGGTGDEDGLHINVDPLGNIYTLGYFSSTTDFDPGPNVHNILAVGNKKRLYIHKMNPNGDFLWVKELPIKDDLICDLEIDNSGNVYITGAFRLTQDFDPDPVAVYNLSAVANKDAFVLKLSPTGDFVWVKALGGGSDSNGRGIRVDALGNIYTIGVFSGTVDFDPGPSVTNLTSLGLDDIYIQKMDLNGDFVWAKQVGGLDSETPVGIALDHQSNIITKGVFADTIDLDPGPAVLLKNSNPIGTSNSSGHFIQKLDTNGNLIWANIVNGSLFGRFDVDHVGSIYTVGAFVDSTDLDPGVGVHMVTYQGLGFSTNAYLLKMDSNGDFVWGEVLYGRGQNSLFEIEVDPFRNIYMTGINTNDTVDLDPGLNMYAYEAGDFFLKLKQQGVSGRVYQDIISNCTQDNLEVGIPARNLLIMPGNIVVTTNTSGTWWLDSLPQGNYTVTVDTSGNWTSNCNFTETFTVAHPDSLTIVSSIALFSTSPCPAPDISINAPFLRPGFSNQKVYIRACNQSIATDNIDTSSYVLIELDTLLSVQGGSSPYVALGNNTYRVELNLLLPNQCFDFWLDCTLDSSAVLGQTLCLKAELLPADNCIFDTIPNPFGLGINPCNTTYDQSVLKIDGHCRNDSIVFEIINIGLGDMSCYAPLQLYIDGQWVLRDSVQLLSGDTAIFIYSADGRTWRMEVAQHPLHLGASFPSKTIELCGPQANWTSNLVNVLPQDDENPNVDIFCGLVSGSHDPNDKTGYPLGIGPTNDIFVNQELEYLIRFQNTGTDTAFTVVIRDTLSFDLDLFSVESGVSSHPYVFRKYGPRVLEWTFYDIKLPDSTVNEMESHGFIKYKVKQTPNLPLGTIIENSAAIYFDYNIPIITNTTDHHLVSPALNSWGSQDTVSVEVCDSFFFNGYVYFNSGKYIQAINHGNYDSLLYVNVVNLSTSSSELEIACDSFVAPDSQIFTSTGQYVSIIPNAKGCDSIINYDVIINRSTIDSINVTACYNYLAPNGVYYNNSGAYTVIIPNALGCDSLIAVDLTITTGAVNTNVTVSGTTLLSQAFGANIQWLNCDSAFAPIVGATSIAYTPSVNGNYAAQITENGCTDTSLCYNVTVTNNRTLDLVDKQWMIYPTPTSDLLFVDNNNNRCKDAWIELMDELGRTILTLKVADEITVMNLEKLPAGIYLLRIVSTNEKFYQKIIKN